MRRVLYLFLAVAICVSLSVTAMFAQVAGDYGSSGNITWYASGATGATWLVFVSASDWSDATPVTTAPTASVNVFIRSGHTVIIGAPSGSSSACKNLTVQSGGVLTSDYATSATVRTLAVTGASSVATVTNNGTLGSETDFIQLQLKCAGTPGVTTLNGNPMTFANLLVNTATGKTYSLTINCDVKFTKNVGDATTSAITFDGGANKDLATLTINAGKTLTVGDACNISYVQSPITSNSIYSHTIILNGTLNTGANGSFSLLCDATHTSTLNIGSTGVLNIKNHFSPASSVGTLTTITVASSGKINVTGGGIIDFSNPNQTVTGTGVVDFTGSTGILNVGAPTGLDVTNGPIRTTGTNVFSPSASYNFVGTSAQSTGTQMPSTVANLLLNSSAGITISQATTVNNMLTLGGNNSYTGLNTVAGYTGVAYAGTVAQATGTELPSSITNLTINNSNDVTLNNNTPVSGILTLTSGKLTTNTNTLSISNTGSVSRLSGYVNGNLQKYIATGATSSSFEVGTPNGYSPVSIVFGTVSTADNLTVSAFQSTHPNAATPANALQRYWNMTPGGLLAFDVYNATFTYLAADFNTGVVEATDEAGLTIGKYSSGWSFPAIGTRTPGGSADGGSIQATGLTSFSSFAIGKDASALPVELSSLSATVNGLNAIIAWTTATETNNYGFDVERRTLPHGVWTKIGFVSGNGTSNTQHQYSYENQKLAAGQYAYRLKQIDNGGAYKYSSETAVTIGAVACDFKIIGAYPNPFNPVSQIQFSFANDGFATLKIYNIIGQQVSTLFEGQARAGMVYEKAFNASGLSSGIYFARLESEGRMQVQKLVLMK